MLMCAGSMTPSASNKNSFKTKSFFNILCDQYQ
jgi:hypothetical protein